MDCVDRYKIIREKVPAGVKIVAVSKTKPASSIVQLYSASRQKIFGENKAQELNQKYSLLPKDIEWHFIGHLQTNKIKFIAPYVSLIQSVDSFKLLVEINKEAKKLDRVIPYLLQFHIATEESKYGFSVEEAISMLEDPKFQELSNVLPCGVMGMATFTEDQMLIRKEFKLLNSYFTTLKSSFFLHNKGFCEISMGMSDDYELAIDEGSTIVRIGSGIFGGR
ncbi:MAG: YggS family pyridoxal phosphate-dependent enzyme [Bacteroidales bacterium]